MSSERKDEGVDTHTRIRFKHKPWQHQGQALMQSWDREAFALYMEQGTGKTKVIIDNAALLRARGLIDGLLIVAPDGVQRAWVRDELPKHMSEDVPYVAAVWSNRQTKAKRREIDAMQNPHVEALRVLAINYELVSTKDGFNAAKDFLQRFRVLMVADESHRIKNHKAIRSAKMHTLSRYAKYRRILTGTPISASPLDVYSQFLFLDPAILGWQSWIAFQAHHAVLEDTNSPLVRAIYQRLVRIHGPEVAARKKPQLIKRDPRTGMPMFRNVDELAKKLEPHSYRILKSACMDLPPKVYQRRFVTLTSEQRKLYSTLKEEFLAEYAGQMMGSPLAITRLTRLQQITGGFFKADIDSEAIPIGTSNPKLDSLLDACEQAAGKVIVWARFKPELNMIAAALEEQFGDGSVARYWGDINSDLQRYAAKKAFMHDPACRFFVSQPKAGGTGLDGLQIADTVIYFSNEFSLIDRLQSEDRAHRGGSEQHEKVTIIDIEAEDTLDRKIIDSLRSKKDISDVITGDDPRQWL